MTAIVYFGIQQLEGNVLTPKIQGDALRVHPILVFLAVIAGAELAGILGVLFAIPALAVLRVVSTSSARGCGWWIEGRMVRGRGRRKPRLPLCAGGDGGLTSIRLGANVL